MQRLNLCVQFLSAASRFCLPVLTVTLESLTLAGTCLLRFLSPSSGFGLHLALLLPLHLSPCADQAIRATTHMLRALPKAVGYPDNQL
ncbi:hypothetical protein GCM10010211_81070 [Streptomyces albospinus]|uniref:Secreted protein n=1 Tax=Streptomyces albospinus TaxID=285515 RepID=A0ABQ2VQT2_9ACTN|nr:hypothetical protein GCM10010211_81070 [Streptomyces albospinus]